MKVLQRVAHSLLLLCVFLLSASVYAVAKDPLTVELPEIEIMPNAQWYWVGRQMALNGVPMSVKMFTSNAKREDIEKFYLSTWKGKGNGKIRNNTFSKRTILGFELDGFFYSVQFEEVNGHIEGKAVVTPTPLNSRESKDTELPVPPRSKLLSKVESLDAGRREETISIDSQFDVSYVADFYKDQLLTDGWSLFSSRGDAESTLTLEFQRNSELLQLIAKQLQHGNRKGSQLLLNWIK